MGHAVINSHSSIPMALYFAVCEFLCPEIVFESLPRRPPDGILTKFIVSAFIGFIFGTMTLRASLRSALTLFGNLLWLQFMPQFGIRTDQLSHPQLTTTQPILMSAIIYGMMVSGALLHRWC